MAERVRVRVRKKKKSKRKIIFKRILLLLTLVLLVAAGFGGYKVYKTINAADNAYDALSRGDKSKLRDKVINMKKNRSPFCLWGSKIMPPAEKADDQILLLSLPLIREIKQ